MSINIKTILNEYIKLDDELKILNKASITLRNQKKILSEQINDYIESNPGENTGIELGKNMFKLIKYTKKKVNNQHIEQVLMNRMKNEGQVKALMDELIEESEESYIKRTIKK